METQGGFLITQVKQVGSRVFEKILSDASIQEFNGAQGKILYVLWQEDGIAINTLAKRVGLANTTLTSMLDRMETAELIRRVSDERDRRKSRIVLTEKARALQGKYDEVSDKMNTLYYVGFSEAEIQQFEDYLRRILKNLEGH